VVKPGAPYRFDQIARVGPGERHRLAVLELPGRRGWWRVWIDRKPITEPIFLPRSHRAWAPVITSESWNGNVGACNDLAYRFEGVNHATRPGGGWRRVPLGYRFQDAGYRLVRLARDSFLAAAQSLLAPSHGRRRRLRLHRAHALTRLHRRALAAPPFGVFF
jgi:hypothetical protein